MMFKFMMGLMIGYLVGAMWFHFIVLPDEMEAQELGWLIERLNERDDRWIVFGEGAVDSLLAYYRESARQDSLEAEIARAWESAIPMMMIYTGPDSIQGKYHKINGEWIKKEERAK